MALRTRFLTSVVTFSTEGMIVRGRGREIEERSGCWNYSAAGIEVNNVRGGGRVSEPSVEAS
jgi:hypothetical protein